MRTLVLTFGILCGALAIPGTIGSNQSAGVPVIGTVALAAETSLVPQEAPKPPQINVEINKGGGGRWYANPVWVAIGGIALILVILLIVMAARGGGGGTTVVRG